MLYVGIGNHIYFQSCALGWEVVALVIPGRVADSFKDRLDLRSPIFPDKNICIYQTHTYIFLTGLHLVFRDKSGTRFYWGGLLGLRPSCTQRLNYIGF